MFSAHAFRHKTRVAAAFHFIWNFRNVQAWFAVNSLSLKCAMVHPDFEIGLPERCVGDSRPPFPHPQKFAYSGAQSELLASVAAKFKSRFGAQSLCANFTSRCEQVGMGSARIASREVAGCVNRQIDRKAVSIGKLLGKSARQIQSLTWGEF